MIKISSKGGFIGLFCGWGLDGVYEVTVGSPMKGKVFMHILRF